MRHDLGLVFASQEGNPLSMGNFRNRTVNPILKKLKVDEMKALGIKRCRNCAFRQMNATMMDEIGTPLETRQHRLGHAQIETILMYYTHKVDAHDRKAADMIGAILSPIVELVN